MLHHPIFKKKIRVALESRYSHWYRQPLLTQNYNSVLTDVREQIKWLALFYCKDRYSFEEALRENDIIPSLEERKNMRDLLSKYKHSKLILITEQPTSYHFLK